MPAFRFVIWLGCACLFYAISAYPAEKMVVVGGGVRPAEANLRFVHWAGGRQADILVITWASDEASPDEYFEYYKNDIQVFRPRSITHAVSKADVPMQRDKLITQIKAASGIFFTGGDQNLAMEVLDIDAKANPKRSLLSLLCSRYHSGIVFGGTSAGTAIMSSPMLTGDGDLNVLDGSQVGARAGLGLLPGVILDQHFLAEGRVLRLMGLMQIYSDKLGMGIDEDTALLIEDSRYAEVVGVSQVLAMYATSSNGSVLVDPLSVGTRYDLKLRRRY